LEQYLNRANNQADFDSDDDDYATPLITPPAEPEFSEKHAISSMDLLPKNGCDASEEAIQEAATKNYFIDEDLLTERMIWDKMYERYHVQFSDLQILVAPNRAKWDAHRLGSRTPLHLIERFSVELTAERRIVFTTDPNYPAIMMTGNLPHLTLHISHKKVKLPLLHVNLFGFLLVTFHLSREQIFAAKRSRNFQRFYIFSLFNYLTLGHKNLYG